VGWIFIVPAHSNNSPRIDRLGFYSVSSLKKTVRAYTCQPTWTHYPASEPTTPVFALSS